MPSNNNTPIATQTRVLKVKIDAELKTKLERQADDMGERGYLLRSSFVLDDSVVNIYQRTR
jgi:hypothetical protein